MGLAQTQAFCGTCSGPALFQKGGINHGRHLVLTLLTVGLWGLVWITLSLVYLLNPYRCARCGETHRSTLSVLVSMLLIFLFAAVGLVKISSLALPAIETWATFLTPPAAP